MSTKRRTSKTIIVALSFAVLAGCATYAQESKTSLYKLRGGDYGGALKATEDQLSAKGDDRLLYHIETGVLSHLTGDYEASNEALEKAGMIAEELYTKRVSDMLEVAMTNPRMAPYPGTDYERVYIHYYKALNYLMLGIRQPRRAREYREGARVEARRIDMLLSALRAEKGNYKEVKDDKRKLFAKTMRVFDILRDSIPDKDLMDYREDAYLRYLSGVVYELNGDWDDARVSYEKAARLYEQGYGEQYRLPGDAAELAWSDTARMLRKVGDPRWKRVVEEKAGAQAEERLREDGSEAGQLVVIEHVDLLPPRKELNIWLRVDEQSRDFLLIPNATGNERDRQEQLAWFSMLYADHGVIDILYNYHQRRFSGVIVGSITQRIPAGPVWGLARQLDLPAAVGPMGVRVTVPYYSPYSVPYRKSRVSLDDVVAEPLVTAASLHQAAYQDLLKDSENELHTAITRQVFKRLVAHQAARTVPLALAKFVGDVATAASSAAETRTCLTLPSEIRVQRYSLPPGKHTLRVTSVAGPGQQNRVSEREVEIPPGGIVISKFRTIAPVTDTTRIAAR